MKTISELPAWSGDVSMRLHAHRPGSSEGVSIDQVAAKAAKVGDIFLKPRAIVDLSGPVLDIARYSAYDSPSDELRKRYEDAIRWFEGLAVGRNRMRVAEKETRKSGFHNVRLVRS